MNRKKETAREVCARVGSTQCFDQSQKVGLAISTIGKSPVYGVRIHPEGDASGWFIWAGPKSDEPDFFQPVHQSHLDSMLPIVEKYLALAPGYKFIIDEDGYEDVWLEPIIHSGFR